MDDLTTRAALDRLAPLLATMPRIQAFEGAAERASQSGVAAFGQTAGSRALVRGPLHRPTGQDAVAASVCAVLNRNHGEVVAELPVAVGTAHALKFHGSTQLVACFPSDGAINRGPSLKR